MLGYGLANSYVQKFSIENIIVSFLNRMLIPNLTYFIGLKIFINRDLSFTNPVNYLTRKIDSFENSKKEIEYLYDLFIEDEYFITRTLEDKNTNLEVDYQKELYKYNLSSNIVLNKDYDFTKKIKESTINDGDDALKKIFFDILLEFINNVKLINGTTEQINNLLKGDGYKLFFKEFKDDKEVKIYTPLDNLSKILELIILKYAKDARKYTSSGFYVYFKNNEYFTVRNNYLEILKKQVVGIGEKRII